MEKFDVLLFLLDNELNLNSVSWYYEAQLK